MASCRTAEHPWLQFCGHNGAAPFGEGGVLYGIDTKDKASSSPGATRAYPVR